MFCLQQAHYSDRREHVDALAARLPMPAHDKQFLSLGSVPYNNSHDKTTHTYWAFCFGVTRIGWNGDLASQ